MPVVMIMHFQMMHATMIFAVLTFTVIGEEYYKLILYFYTCILMYTCIHHLHHLILLPIFILFVFLVQHRVVFFLFLWMILECQSRASSMVLCGITVRKHQLVQYHLNSITNLLGGHSARMYCQLYCLPASVWYRRNRP